MSFLVLLPFNKNTLWTRAKFVFVSGFLCRKFIGSYILMMWMVWRPKKWMSCCAKWKSEFVDRFCVFTVNRIKELHKVTVRIPPDNEKSNLIRIEGDPQGVQEAKKELLELASRMVSQVPIQSH